MARTLRVPATLKLIYTAELQIVSIMTRLARSLRAPGHFLQKLYTIMMISPNVEIFYNGLAKVSQTFSPSRA